MIRNKFKFYLLSCTWGCIMTLIGFVAACILRAIGYRPKKWGYCYYFEVGKGWGGVSFGPVFIVSKDSYDSVYSHEHGHAHQNCIWGILFPFAIAIPSVTRYWYREWLVRSGRKKYSELPDYDSVWYEGEASKIGTEFINWYNNNTK